MRTKPRQSGLTLPEMTVVVAIIAMLTAIGLPAVRALLNSFQTQSGAENLIGAALSNARAIAAKEQHYAGIRFQQDSTGKQYIVFIVHDYDKTGLNPGFRAIEGVKPIKLPETSRIMDLRVRTNHGTTPRDAADALDEPLAAGYLNHTNPLNLGSDENNVHIRDGVYRPDNSVPAQLSTDDVLNSPQNIANFGLGKFVQDDYAELGLGAEPSRNRFVVCDMTQFDKLNAMERFDYLRNLELVHINPYTGTIISPN